LSNKESTPLLNHSNKRVQWGNDISASEDTSTASLTGRIDIDSSPAVRDRLLAFLRAPHARTVSIDLSGVTLMDSSGVATLIEALKIAQSYNTELKLQGLEGRLLRLFQSTGILSLFNGSTRASSQAGWKAL
jgi:anti-anti-sigma factor